MILTKEAITELFKGLIGDRDDDEAIKALEDFTDTITDYDVKTKDSTDWEQKYNNLDKEWRTKYRERFFSGEGESGGSLAESEPDSEPDTSETITINDLFTEA